MTKAMKLAIAEVRKRQRESRLRYATLPARCCGECGALFEPVIAGRWKYCSQECYADSNRGRGRERRRAISATRRSL
jgi:hypothetical protein